MSSIDVVALQNAHTLFFTLIAHTLFFTLIASRRCSSISQYAHIIKRFMVQRKKIHMTSSFTTFFFSLSLTLALKASLSDLQLRDINSKNH
jgi:hypothetical protein